MGENKNQNQNNEPRDSKDSKISKEDVLRRINDVNSIYLDEDIFNTEKENEFDGDEYVFEDD